MPRLPELALFGPARVDRIMFETLSMPDPYGTRYQCARWLKLNIPQAQRTDWRTPTWLYDELNKEFNFDIDVFASAENAKCKFFYDKEQNAFTRSWSAQTNIEDASTRRKSAFANPPFNECKQAVLKALEERSKLLHTVMLLPYRAGSRWFYENVHGPLFTDNNPLVVEGKVRAEMVEEIKAISGAYYYGFASRYGELRILTKRLAFDDAKKVAAFDCCVVVWRGGIN